MALVPGMGAPMGTATPPGGPSPVLPTPQDGLIAQARTKMSVATRELIGALSMMKTVGTDEAKACVDALKILSKVVPDVSESMAQSEIGAMLSNAQAVRPQPGQGGGMLGMARPVPQPIAGGPMGMR